MAPSDGPLSLITVTRLSGTMGKSKEVAAILCKLASHRLSAAVRSARCGSAECGQMRLVITSLFRRSY